MPGRCCCGYALRVGFETRPPPVGAVLDAALTISTVGKKEHIRISCMRKPPIKHQQRQTLSRGYLTVLPCFLQLRVGYNRSLRLIASTALRKIESPALQTEEIRLKDLSYFNGSGFQHVQSRRFIENSTGKNEGNQFAGEFDNIIAFIGS